MQPGQGIAEAFVQGIREEAPRTECRLAEYRHSVEFTKLSIDDQKRVGLLHWIVKSMAQQDV